MYHRVRRKMNTRICAILFLSCFVLGLTKSIDIKYSRDPYDIDNDIIDFDDEYSLKYNKKLGMIPWSAHDFNKDSYKYSIDKGGTFIDRKINIIKEQIDKNTINKADNNTKILNPDKTTESNLIPIELLSTTEVTVEVDSTTEDLTVIPLSTEKIGSTITINQTVTLPASTEISEDFNLTTGFFELTTKGYNDTTIQISTISSVEDSTNELNTTTETTTHNSKEIPPLNVDVTDENDNITSERLNRSDFDSTESNEEVPIFTELDAEDVSHVPEDYYDSKDVVPTSAPKTDALSVLFGFAGSVVESVVESVAERVVPKGLFDLFKRMQKQNEALEAEKLRSREENGGIGQFTRGVIKSISSGLSKPLSQLMAGVRDIGSLDSDRGFVNSLASSVTSVATVANSMVDVFKDRVQAIYPGTVWCGDGHAAQARSSDLGLFFFTDTCCRQHDACKLYIKAGETKFGLTNTGLFTRSHCSCDVKFRDCLRKTNSLVSGQIGLTYFNVLGPQCFRRAHPIVRCVRRTRITGLKCEEYELDLTKPKMWQWFDNETF